MTHDAKTLLLPALAAATLVVALAAGGGRAQAPVVADDVQCSPDPCVDTSDIVPGAVNATVIAKGSIGRNKLAPGAVDGTVIADGSIGRNKLMPGAVDKTIIAIDSVGSKEIIDHSVGAVDLAPNAVRSAHIANGTVSSYDLADGAVTSEKIGNDAVRADNIAYRAVTGYHLALGTVHAAHLAPEAVFSKIILVRADPMDYIGNCLKLTSVLSRFTSSNTTRTLIKLEPGIYNCRDNLVTMKPFVDLEGSGEGVTIIKGNRGNSVEVLRGANDSELRFLTVVNSGESNTNQRVAINTSMTNQRLTHVTAIAEIILYFSASDHATAVIAEGTSQLTAVTAKAAAPGGTFARGIQVQNTTTENFVKMVNVTASGTGATTNQGLWIAIGDSAVARNSVFSGSTAAVENNGDAGLAATQLHGPTGGTGIYRCAAAYDASFTVLSASC